MGHLGKDTSSRPSPLLNTSTSFPLRHNVPARANILSLGIASEPKKHTRKQKARYLITVSSYSARGRRHPKPSQSDGPERTRGLPIEPTRSSTTHQVQSAVQGPRTNQPRSCLTDAPRSTCRRRCKRFAWLAPTAIPAASSLNRRADEKHSLTLGLISA